MNIQYKFNMDSYHPYYYDTNRWLLGLFVPFTYLSNARVTLSLPIWPIHWDTTTVIYSRSSKKKIPDKLIGRKGIRKFSTFSPHDFPIFLQHTFEVLLRMIFCLSCIINIFIDASTNAGIKQQCYLPTTDIDAPDYWHKFCYSTNLKVACEERMEYFL